jgi:hypothetical protein
LIRDARHKRIQSDPISCPWYEGGNNKLFNKLFGRLIWWVDPSIAEYILGVGVRRLVDVLPVAGKTRTSLPQVSIGGHTSPN